MHSIGWMFFFVNAFCFQWIRSKRDGDDVDHGDIFDADQYKRAFANTIENDREYVAALDKRKRLARIKFEEHCEPKGKSLTRICPTVEQCLSKPSSLIVKDKNEIRRRALRTMLEERENANQFLHPSLSRKRFFLSALMNPNDQYNEKQIRERRRRGLLMYEDYCESTDYLPRACPPIDRCRCGDCDQ